MVFKLRKRLVLFISGLVAVSIMILIVLDGDWSPVQITVLFGTVLISAVSLFYYFRAEGVFQINLVNLTLSLLALVFALILAEILARTYLLQFASQAQFNQFASVNQFRDRYGKDYLSTGGILPHRYIGYYPTPYFQEGLNKHNSLGFRGDEIEVPKPEGIFRIVCVGGSTTYSQVEDYTKSYPFLLQEFLHQAGHPSIEVINAGMIGYTSWESLTNLEFRVLDLEPDLLIIYHAINDVATRLVWPPNAYRGDNSGMRIIRLQPVQMPPIWEYSTILRTAAIMLGASQPHSSLNWHFIENPQTSYAEIFIEQKEMGIYPRGIFEEVSAKTMMEENPPIYFERNLKNMIAIAEVHDIDVVLLTFAFSRFTDPRVGSQEFQTGIAEGNEIIKNVAAEAGVYLYDLAGDLHNVTDDMPTAYKNFTDGHHFNERGNELRAALIGDFLIEAAILPE